MFLRYLEFFNDDVGELENGFVRAFPPPRVTDYLIWISCFNKVAEFIRSKPATPKPRSMKTWNGWVVKKIWWNVPKRYGGRTAKDFEVLEVMCGSVAVPIIQWELHKDLTPALYALLPSGGMKRRR